MGSGPIRIDTRSVPGSGILELSASASDDAEATIRGRVPASYGSGPTFGDRLDRAGRPLGFPGSITHSNPFSHRANAVERVFSSAGVAESDVDYTGTASTRSFALGAS